MRKALTTRMAIVLAVFAMIAAACSSDDGAEEASATTTTAAAETTTTTAQQLDIVDTAVEAGSFSTLVQAVQAAGLVETLKGEGPFTVFAPTDEAFAALPDGALDILLSNPEWLEEVLLTHVVSGSIDAEQVVGLESATTVAGNDVAVAVEGDDVSVGGASVVTADIQTSNGIIHVIDQVIVPQSILEQIQSAMAEMEAEAAGPGTIAEVAAEAGNFETLLTAVEAAGLTDTLNGEGPFTVFAPTDEAFAALPEGTLESLLEDIPALTDILLYHVVPGEFPAEDVTTLGTVTTAQGMEITITVDEGTVFVDNAEMIVTDIQADNGIIHVIDQVILPGAMEDAEAMGPGTIAEVAAEAGNFETLLTAVEAAGLTDTLNGEGPFTVFAPTDEAFAALPEGTLESLLEDIPALTDILLYHVVPGEVPAADVVNLESATTAQGSDVQITVEDGTVFVDGAEVIMTDIEADNGIIHVIDAVITP